MSSTINFTLINSIASNSISISGVTFNSVDGITFLGQIPSITIPDNFFNSSVYKLQIKAVTFNGTKIIGNNCINSCLNLEDVSLNTVETIGSNAFNGCAKLINIPFSNSLMYILEGAFLNCTQLTNIILPNSIRTINKNAFLGCINIETFIWSTINNMTILAEGTLSNCSKLTNIIIPEGITEIGPLCFSDCTLLERVQLPSTIQTIGAFAFKNCSSLKTIINAGQTENTLAFSGLTSSGIVDTSIAYKTSDNVFTSLNNFVGGVQIDSVNLPNYITNTVSSNFVDINNEQTITGLKSFTVSPIMYVPLTTSNNHNTYRGANLKYVDDSISTIKGNVPSNRDTLQKINEAIDLNSQQLSRKIDASFSTIDSATIRNSILQNTTIFGNISFSSATPTGLTKSSVGLSNVDNTSDLNKPISTQTSVALALKAPLEDPTFRGNVSFINTSSITGLNKAHVGLNNVDNTSDLNKPISTAVETALTTKAPIINPTFQGTVTFADGLISGIDKSTFGLENVENTSDINKPLSTATQLYVDSKVNDAITTLIGGSTEQLSTINDLATAIGNLSGDVTGAITTQLTEKADKNAVVNLVDNQTIGGVKTFNIAPFIQTAIQSENSNMAASTAYVRTAISNMLDGAPQALDTLKELSLALNNDASFASTIATQLATKAPSNSPVFTGVVDFQNAVLSGISKSTIGLGNVDNTSDLNKPISTATQNVLNTKAPINDPTFTGTITTPSIVLNGTNINTILSGKQDIINACTINTTQTITGKKIMVGGLDISGGGVSVLSGPVSFPSLSISETAINNNAISSGYVDATSSIQTQLNDINTVLTTKQDLISTTNDIIETSTELLTSGGAYVALNLKQNALNACTTDSNQTISGLKTFSNGIIVSGGLVSLPTNSISVSAINNYSMSNGFVDATSSIQTQLDTKLSIADATNTYTTFSYVDTKISDILGSAPENLNALSELAAALNGDASFASTVAGQIGLKADKSYVDTNLILFSDQLGTMATISYVDNNVSIIDASLTNLMSSKADTSYVDTQIANVVSGNSSININSISGLTDILNEKATIVDVSNTYLKANVASFTYANLSDYNTHVTQTNNQLNTIINDISNNYYTKTQTNLSFVSNNDFINGLAAKADLSHVDNNFLTLTDASNTYVTLENFNTELNSKASISQLNIDLLTKANSIDVETTYLSKIDASNSYAKIEYVDYKVAELIGSAPENLNALNELANAINGDASFASTISSQIGLKADKTYVDTTFLTTNNATSTYVTITDKNNIQLEITDLSYNLYNNYLTIEDASNTYVSQTEQTTAINTINTQITNVSSSVDLLAVDVSNIYLKKIEASEIYTTVTTHNSAISTINNDIQTIVTDLSENYLKTTEIMNEYASILNLNNITTNIIQSIENISIDLSTNYSTTSQSDTKYVSTIIFDTNKYNMETTISDISENLLNNYLKTSDLSNNYAKITYVDSKIQEVIGTAPSTLDTLKELSDALNGDASFANSIATQLATKADSDLIANTYLSINDAINTYSTITYVDQQISNVVSGGGSITLDSINGLSSILTDLSTNYLKIIDASNSFVLKTDLNSTVNTINTAINNKANYNAVVNLTDDQTINGIKTFTSLPIVPTATNGTNNTLIANTQFVQSALTPYLSSVNASNTYATKNSPIITGTMTVADISTNSIRINGVDLNTTLSGFQTLLTFDTEPINGSNNIVTSEGIYNALNIKANDTEVVKLNGEQSVDGVKTFSSSIIIPTPEQNDITDAKAVNIRFVKDAISNAINLLVDGAPEALNTLNKIVSDLSANSAADQSFATAVLNSLSQKINTTDVSNTYLKIGVADSTYLSQSAAASTYLTQTDATNYLQTTDASNTYLKIGEAISIYAPISEPIFTGTVTVDDLTIVGGSYTSSLAAKLDEFIKASDVSIEYLSKTDAETIYLTIADASSTYLTITDVSNNYILKSTAENIYLSQSSASETYLTQINATNEYLSKADATNTYLKQTDATTTFAQISSLNDYLLSTDASNTYLKITDASTNLATKDFVSSSISNLVNSAPETLNTLNELATALNNDSNFATTVTNSLATKADKSYVDTTFATTETLSNYSTTTQIQNTYIPASTIISTYLTQTDASNTYLTQTDATNTYLTQTDATNTYLTMSSASSIYITPSSAPSFTDTIDVKKVSEQVDSTKAIISDILSLDYLTCTGINYISALTNFELVVTNVPTTSTNKVYNITLMINGSTYANTCSINGTSVSMIADGGLSNITIDAGTSYVLQQFNIMFLNSSVPVVVTNVVSLY